METALIDYYQQRAAEYESVYLKPERQADLRRLRDVLTSNFRGHDILEIACGTGYWTEALSTVARSVVACDINSDVLAIARQKNFGPASVELIRADSYALPEFGREFSATFAGFWWSHIPKRHLVRFLNGLHARLKPGALVMFVDNRYVEGSSTPITRVDEHGDSFQQRRLANGSVHDVLKNFPSEEELRSAIRDRGSAVELTLTEFYWCLSYRVRS